VRRLCSTFASGLPGLGLLLIRLGIGLTACGHGIELLKADSFPNSLLPALFHLGLGGLFVMGLWTPVAGALLALTAGFDVYIYPALRCQWALVGTVAIAAALIGPGRWSVDCRLFGWKRIDIPERRRPEPPP
jgi:hypothetical protein